MRRRRFESPEIGRGIGWVCDQELVRLFGTVERNDYRFALAICEGDEIGATQLTQVWNGDPPVKKVCIVWGKDWDSARINFLKKLGAREELAELKQRIARRDAQREWYAARRAKNAKLGLNVWGKPIGTGRTGKKKKSRKKR